MVGGLADRRRGRRVSGLVPPGAPGSSPVGAHSTGGPSARLVPRLAPVRVQLAVSFLLLAVVVVGGLYVSLGPSDDVVDRLGYAAVPDQWAQPFWHHVTSVGEPPGAVIGVLLAAAWAFGRNRRRAVTCVVAPLLAVFLCEVVIKPLVGRRLGGTYDYPSGHVTTATAMLASLVLATPRRWRWLTGCVAGGVAALVALAVVASRQHYPSDAVAGLFLAPAVVLLVDGVNRPWITPQRSAGSGPSTTS